ncbi:hypothetical protein Ancab_025707 [Ancistrocladus abbreviatus]
MGMGGGSTAAAAPMKVVYINTQYVETDAMSFKSVVQKLTGKDATVAMDSVRQFVGAGSRGGFGYGKVEGDDHGGKERGLMRDLSFKEIDRLLKELPPLDQLLGCSPIESNI